MLETKNGHANEISLPIATLESCIYILKVYAGDQCVSRKLQLH
jgi:hypothetical protein